MKRISLVVVAEMCTKCIGTLSFKLLISKSQGKTRVAKGGGGKQGNGRGDVQADSCLGVQRSNLTAP